VEANDELKKEDMEVYFTCCGKKICKGCLYSFDQSGNEEKCPFCNANRFSKTDEEMADQIMKRVEANDAASTYLLANSYHNGLSGFQKDHARAIELYAQAADLGHSQAHNQLANIYWKGGDMKKAKFHYEAAAIAGHEGSRCCLGIMDCNSGNKERAVKHWTISASAGYHFAMHELITCFEKGLVSRESIDSTLEAYNNSCAEMRSEDRDAYIRTIIEAI
jgi:tetratricopeptide (TPR) repeat protein